MNFGLTLPQKNLYHAEWDRWFEKKVKESCKESSSNLRAVEKLFYQCAWGLMTPFLYAYDALVPRVQWHFYSKPISNGMGNLNPLPNDVLIQVIALEFLSFKECSQLAGASKLLSQSINQEVLKKKYVNYLLPIEAFGNLEMCKQILPMPQKLLEVLHGPDGHLYFPFLKASRFLHKADGQEEIFPATYRGIEKVSKLRGKVGYKLIWNELIDQEGTCELQKMQWILMTKDVLLGSKSKTYEHQVTFVQNWISENPSLREGFEIPKDPRDAIYLIFYQFCQDQTRLYSDSPWTCMRCQKFVNGYPVILGGFGLFGLHVTYRYIISRVPIGVGVLRKF